MRLIFLSMGGELDARYLRGAMGDNVARRSATIAYTRTGCYRCHQDNLKPILEYEYQKVKRLWGIAGLSPNGPLTTRFWRSSNCGIVNTGHDIESAEPHLPLNLSFRHFGTPQCLHQVQELNFEIS